MIRDSFRYDLNPIYFQTAFFALFVFTGVFNSFNARTHRLNLLAHLRGNPLFALIMVMVAVVQLLLIYFGGSLFRTAGLTSGELRTVLMIAFWVIPADLLRNAGAASVPPQRLHLTGRQPSPPSSPQLCHKPAVRASPDGEARTFFS